MKRLFSPLVLSAFLIFLTFVLRASSSLDPDFGWHIRMGEIVRGSGVPATDPFSYTMPSFPFVDHEWLTNLTLGKLYETVGYFGLAFIFSALGVASFLISLKNPLSQKIKAEKASWILGVSLFTVSSAALAPFFGVRPQVISWLLFAILFRIILVPEAWKKFKYFVPPLFLLWANLHGSFGAGIVILFFVLALRALRTRRISFSDISVALLSLGATLINPYRGRAWGEVWLQISDSSLRWSILEWMPVFFNFNLPLLILIVFCVLLTWKYKARFLLEEKVLFIALLLQALASQRHAPIWGLVVLPMARVAGINLYLDAKKIKFGKGRFVKVFAVALIAMLGYLAISLWPYFSKGPALSEANFYPKGAVYYLKSNLPSGNIFSNYGWGGYLIWKLPEKKVFIDGRMPSWRWKADIVSEENYAMKTYQAVLSGQEDYLYVFGKYGIDTALWLSPKSETALSALERKIEVFLAEYGIPQSQYDLIKELEKGGWKRVYEDTVSVIYKKTL